MSPIYIADEFFAEPSLDTIDLIVSLDKSEIREVLEYLADIISAIQEV